MNREEHDKPYVLVPPIPGMKWIALAGALIFILAALSAWLGGARPVADPAETPASAP